MYEGRDIIIERTAVVMEKLERRNSLCLKSLDARRGS